MKKKIFLTESQLKKVIDVVSEQQFDEVITSYNREKRETVSIPEDDAKMLVNISKHWCRDKENHPDCEEILRIQSTLNLY